MRFLFALLLQFALIYAQTWNVSNSISLTVMTGVYFSSPQYGYIAGGENGQGPVIARSSDFGNTWQNLNVPSNDFMTIAIASSGPTSAVATGLGFPGDIYTKDGTDFYASKSPYVLESVQDAEVITGGGYALVGSFNDKDGVSYSTDGGATFKLSSFTCASGYARYGSFPTSSIWYVSCGSWPNNNPNKETHHSLSSKFHIAKDHSDVKHTPNTKTSEVSDGVWGAAIMKTLDGGKTYKALYNSTGSFYFNQISCPSASRCMAVGENDSNAFVFTTTNGGISWTTVQTFPNLSLMACKCLSDDICWVGGGIESYTITGSAMKTENFGQTFKNYAVNDFYFNDFSFAGANHGYATGFDAEGTSAFVEYQ